MNVRIYFKSVLLFVISIKFEKTRQTKPKGIFDSQETQNRMLII